MKATLFLLLLLSATTVCAQKKQNIYYLDKQGRETDQKDKAEFIRIIKKPDSGSVNFTINK